MENTIDEPIRNEHMTLQLNDAEYASEVFSHLPVLKLLFRILEISHSRYDSHSRLDSVP